MNDFGFSPLSGLPLIHAVTKLERKRPSWRYTDPPTYRQYQVEGYYSYYTGEPSGGWATNLDFAPDPGQRQARPVKPEAPYQIGELDLRQAELEKLKAYAVSIAVLSRLQAQQFGGGSMPLFVSGKELKALSDSEIETPNGFRPYAIEHIWQQALRMPLSEKAITTLDVLALIESQPGNGVVLAFQMTPYPGGIARMMEMPNYPGEPSLPPQGIIFACMPTEIGVVLHMMKDLGWIDPQQIEPINKDGGAYLVVHIRPQGYQALEEYRRGNRTRKAFLVCPSKASYRALYDEICRKVGDHPEVMCEIKPVWADPHVEKIDDRIFRLIREATIIVVDLDLTNFNVALEAGFALALGKPIVWTRKEPWVDNNPFDIYSHMILKWSEAEPERFEEDLRSQVLAAFEKARGGR